MWYKVIKDNNNVKIEEILKDNNIKINGISRNIYGKPFLIDSSTKYNLSHSNGVRVIIISDCEVGIDIEFCRELEYVTIAQTFFCNSEYEYIKNSKDIQKAFFRIWTLKEAYLKMNGIGLTRRLNSFSVMNFLRGEQVIYFEGKYIYINHYSLNDIFYLAYLIWLK
ncbi:TPA: 4'-phosphopantetheinyl transferase superfamily protein [Staphylococcus pseudintermedius]|nr:4'-phosphopantetheinyl transferase superfamily protein [Staphylococcus pseudintermedius]EJD8499355.1 4'-phosphopantetheinyl transferase superfamily protein [Staphylococcus pseudintermedius]EJD8521222.1 4'-phosphopantetheinyl transferase superfamily protein [Staphylococcus pseudintermedius]HAR6574035.1 4'-phosphopantetheinyl transferase superfamily protein [Staphylococcus pseudintermedius]